jgi:hypothetical protein
MPTLPAGFEPTTSGGYSHDGPAGVLRTEVAGGPARYAADWSRGAQRYNISMLLDAYQFSIWNAFYAYSIRKGAIPFDMPINGGFGMQQLTVSIVPGSYQAVQADTFTTVSFTAEGVSPAYAMTDAEVSAFAAANGLSAAALPPGIVPVVSPGGYSHGGPDGVAGGDVAGGHSAYAMEWDRGVQQFNVTLFLNPAEYAAWSVWFYRLIGKGVQSFEMPLDSGFGVQPHLVNIVPGSYSATHNDGFVVVSLTVEGESKVYDLGEEAGLALVEMAFLYGGGIGLLLKAIEKFATVDTLVLSI